jgi:Tol biopolymer transport system component
VVKFSLDSQRIAYMVSRDIGQDMGEVVVLDGIKGTSYSLANNIPIGQPFFSPDSQRLAYKVLKSGKQAIVVDGVEGKLYTYVSEPVFNPDGEHVAYIAGDGDRGFVIVDGVESKKYDNILQKWYIVGGSIFLIRQTVFTISLYPMERSI